MNLSPRPDLINLSENDLVRFTSAGLVKRARREADDPDLIANVQQEANDLVCSWSEGITCRFPPASTLHGVCSCPATDVCRHLIRSIFFLQNHPELFGNQSEPQAKDDTAEHVSVALLLDGDEQLLQQIFGKGELKRARSYLAKKGMPEIIEPRSRVRFPREGVETRFLLGAPPERALCTCGEPMPCPHVIPSLLALRGECAPASPDPPIDEKPLDCAKDRVREILFDLMRLGLDGLSSEWCEAARTTALEVDKVGLPIHASLVERLANTVEDELTHQGRGDVANIRFLLAALWIRIRPNHQNATQLVSTRSHEWKAGPKQLLGVGVRAWENDKVRGLTCYLMDLLNGQIVSIGTARPLENDFTAAQLARAAPILGDWTASDLSRRIVQLSDSTFTNDGKVRLPQGATAQITSIAAEDLDAVDRFSVIEWAALANFLNADFPTIITLRQQAIFWFKPQDLWPATFLVAEQWLQWPMIDRVGRVLMMRYQYRAERSEPLEALRRFSHEVKPTHVLGRIQWSGSFVSIEPISFLYDAQARQQSYVVDIDGWGNAEKGRARKSTPSTF